MSYEITDDIEHVVVKIPLAVYRSAYPDRNIVGTFDCVMMRCKLDNLSRERVNDEA